MTDRAADRTGDRLADLAGDQAGVVDDNAFAPGAPDDLAAAVPDVAATPPVPGPAESSFVRSRSARRRWRRRLAALLVAGFVVGWLGFGATIYRDSFERKQEKNAKKALAAGEFAGVRVVANGRKLVLEGSVASAADAKTAADLVSRVRHVKGVDTSKLQIGGSAGRVLPLTAIYSEGKVSFEGTRPSEEALQALVKAAAAGLGDANVSAQFAEPTGSGGDTKAYAALGSAFARFPAINVRSAVVDVSEVEVTVTGRVADDSGRSELVQTLSGATSRTVIDNLELELASSTTPGTPAVSTVAGGGVPSSAETPSSLPGATPGSTLSPTSTPTPVATLEPATRTALQQEIDATLTANKIEFNTDSAALGAAAKAIIADLAARLAPTGAAFEIGGHTDSRGRADRNLALSQRRAEAVRAEFISQGIAADRVTAVGYGSQKTIAPDNDSRGNPLNRRIEITLK